MVHAARKIGDQLYAVDSFSGEGGYTINMAGVKATCTCPHYTKRLTGTDRVCKHIDLVKEQAPRIEALEKARGCTDSQIAALLPKYANSPVEGGALRVVRAERKAATENEVKLRSVFA